MISIKEDKLCMIDIGGKMEKYIPDMDFDIMWEDECLGHITICDEEITRAEQKDCELWKRFIPLECEKLTIPLLASLFLERLWDENRADIDEVHRQLGVKYHNPFQMVLKTRGGGLITMIKCGLGLKVMKISLGLKT